MKYSSEVIKKLDKLKADDSERAHIEADELLLSYVMSTGAQGREVAKAYIRAKLRVVFWYA